MWDVKTRCLRTLGGDTEGGGPKCGAPNPAEVSLRHVEGPQRASHEKLGWMWAPLGCAKPGPGVELDPDGLAVALAVGSLFFIMRFLAATSRASC